MNITLFEKRDFAHVIKLSILIWEDYPRLSECTQRSHKVSYKGGRGVTDRGRCDGGSRGTERKRFEDATFLALKIEEEAISQGIQAAPRICKGQGNRFFPRASQMNTALWICFRLLISRTKR